MAPQNGLKGRWLATGSPSSCSTQAARGLHLGPAALAAGCGLGVLAPLAICQSSSTWAAAQAASAVSRAARMGQRQQRRAHERGHDVKGGKAERHRRPRAPGRPPAQPLGLGDRHDPSPTRKDAPSASRPRPGPDPTAPPAAPPARRALRAIAHEIAAGVLTMSARTSAYRPATPSMAELASRVSGMVAGSMRSPSLPIRRRWPRPAPASARTSLRRRAHRLAVEQDAERVPSAGAAKVHRR